MKTNEFSNSEFLKLYQGVRSFNGEPFTKLQLFKKVFGGVVYLGRGMFECPNYKNRTKLFMKHFLRAGRIHHVINHDWDGYQHCIYAESRK